MSGRGHGEKLSRRGEQAVAALLSEPTIAAAAGRVGVAESTLRRWSQEPEFRAAYAAARRGALETALTDVQLAARRAVAALLRHVDGDNPNASVRAASVILDRAARGAEILDLVARIESLEATLPQTRERPGAPPRTMRGRVERLEGVAPSGCAVCVDAERLAHALADAARDGQPLSDHCPQCGGKPGPEVAWAAHLRVIALRAGTA